MDTKNDLKLRNIALCTFVFFWIGFFSMLVALWPLDGFGLRIVGDNGETIITIGIERIDPVFKQFFSVLSVGFYLATMGSLVWFWNVRD